MINNKFIKSDTMLSIFRYNDCQEFLEDLKNNLENKESGKKATYDDFAKLFKVNSRTKAKKIIKGQANISKSAIENLCTQLNLNKTEHSFLELLRLISNCQDVGLASSLFDKILKIRKAHTENIDSYKLQETQLEILQNWYILPVLTYFDLKDAPNDIFSILKAFKGQLKEEEIKKAIESLVKTKLLKYNENGELIKIHETISLLDEIPRPLVKKFHFMMIDRAKNAIIKMPQEKRQALSTTININEEKLSELKKDISKFIVNMNNKYSSTTANALYQLNTQLFNLASINE